MDFPNSRLSQHDLETGDHRKSMLTQSSWNGISSATSILGLFRRIHNRARKRVSYEEADVYHRLMDDLDYEEEPSLRYSKLFILLEIVVLLGLVGALVTTLTVERIKRRRVLRLHMWQWVVMVMVLVSGISAARFVTFLVFAPVKWWWRIHKYVVYFLNEIKWSVDVTLWFGLVLVAWYLWFRPKVRNVDGDLSVIATRQTTRLLIALVLGSFLWTLKNLLYLKLKADLHYDELYDRIQRAVLDLHGIQIMYHKGVWKFLSRDENKMKKTKEEGRQAKEADKEKHEGEQAERSGGDENRRERSNSLSRKKRSEMEGKNIWLDVYRMKKETVPIWIVRRLAHTYLKQKKGLPRKRDAAKDDQKLMDEAQQMLREVIGEEGRHDILPKDLDKYDLNDDERKHVFEIFETEEEKEQKMKQCTSQNEAGDQENKVITRYQFLRWAVVAYKNCWGLERTLHSSERVFVKLNRILGTFLVTIMLIIWLLLSKIVDTAQLALLFAPFVAASFIFGDTCKKMFEGLIFAFAMHPFDVGDRVVIEEVQMKVSQLNILTSVFFKYDTGEEVVYPNSVLASTKIINLDITPDQADSLEFTILSNTPSEDITDLELKIKKALDDDLTYTSQTKVVKKEFGKEEIKMVVYFKYLVSYLSAETKAMHRSRILTKIMEFTKEMNNNNKEDPSAYKLLDPLKFTLDSTFTLEQINELKSTLSSKFKDYMEHSKLLMKHLDKTNIEMVLHPRRLKSSSDSNSQVDDLKQQVSSAIESFKEQLKSGGHIIGTWSRHGSQIRSLGRTSQNEGSTDEASSSNSGSTRQ